MGGFSQTSASSSFVITDLYLVSADATVLFVSAVSAPVPMPIFGVGVFKRLRSAKL